MQAKGLTDKSRLNRTELAILIGAAVVTMTLASTCSPLYPFNPWDDANCFFTLGRGITHGLVPYRDLAELVKDDADGGQDPCDERSGQKLHPSSSLTERGKTDDPPGDAGTNDRAQDDTDCLGKLHQP